MHFFITGHTGFKGTWLSYLLAKEGHEVSGYALDPAEGSLFADSSIAKSLSHDFRADIRDAEALIRALSQARRSSAGNNSEWRALHAVVLRSSRSSRRASRSRLQ